MFLNARYGLSVYHFVGHGLCIGREKLRELHGFPENFILEDVALGFRAAVLGNSVHVVPTFELSDSPRSFVEGFRLQYRWASGVQQYHDFHRALYTEGILSNRGTLWRSRAYAMQGLAGAVAWNTSAYLLAIAAYSAFVGSVFAGTFLTLYFLEFVICAAYFWRLGYIHVFDLLLLPAYLVVEFAKRSVPANLALIRRLLGLPLRVQKATHERSGRR
jgi:hypothetical protein